MKDSIRLKNIQAFSKLGIYDHERILGQVLYIDLDLELNLKQACLSNKLEHTIDYAKVSVMIRELSQSKEFYLLEGLAHEIVLMLFKNFPILEGVKIEIKKTIVNAEHFSGQPSIKLKRLREEL